MEREDDEGRAIRLGPVPGHGGEEEHEEDERRQAHVIGLEEARDGRNGIRRQVHGSESRARREADSEEQDRDGRDAWELEPDRRLVEEAHARAAKRQSPIGREDSLPTGILIHAHVAERRPLPERSTVVRGRNTCINVKNMYETIISPR